MDISICIVSWNTKDLLHRCLTSIKKKTQGVQYEVVVVDNSSSDGSADMVHREFPDCQLVASRINLGFVKGNNLAVAQTTGKYVLYLNPDTELVTNAIRGMFHYLEHHSDFGAAGCRLINPDGSIQYTCASTFPTPFSELCHYLLLNRLFKGSRRFSARELNFWDHQTSRTIDCLSGACMMVRRDLVEQLGGFDEHIFMYSEDLDLCYRLRQQGAKLYYLASEVIIHREGSSTARKANKFSSLLQQKESNCYFLSKHFGPFKAGQFRLVTAVGAACRIIASLLCAPWVVLQAQKQGKSFRAIFMKQVMLLAWSCGLAKLTRQPLRGGYNYAG